MSRDPLTNAFGWPHKMRQLTVFLAALALPGAAHAAENQYVCTIAELLNLESDGSLKAQPAPWPIGRRFVIDRNSGAIAGPDSTPWTTPDSKFAVFAKGSRQSAFIAMAMTPGGGNGGSGAPAISTIINEHHPGAKKSFVLSAGTQVAAGTCE